MKKFSSILLTVALFSLSGIASAVTAEVAVPAPPVLGLFMIGLAGVGAATRRRKR